jgi:hypothetical protein
MAVENVLLRISGPAASDLSAKQFYALQLVSGTDFSFNLATAATQKPGGILQNKPTAGLAVDAAITGLIKYLAGGTIHVGDRLTATSTGKLIATTTDKDGLWGMAVTEAVDGDVATMLAPCPATLSAT